MKNDMQRQRSLMDRTGLGLLPGIAIAFGVVMIAMLSLTFATWWVTFAAVGVLLCATCAVALVIVKLIDVDGGDHPVRR